MTCAWMETSSAEIGSSQTIKSGSSASVLAIPIRCLWPPEKFMRISPDVVRFQSNRFQQLLHAFFSLFFIVHVMNHHRLLNNLTDGKTGI